MIQSSIMRTHHLCLTLAPLPSFVLGAPRAMKILVQPRGIRGMKQGELEELENGVLESLPILYFLTCSPLDFLSAPPPAGLPLHSTQGT